ncbi:hypothetical protein KJ657_02090 [Patescibacteria group bacterium]|nr:hypothetical protein [Patescibacteria group bacterium]MBU1015859.1 hypothetical protein [Patescibacteria group bacterium]MBU1685392.1 hypothetical protein [Patescibacteria group bacterium]MBU1938449.1 hypothetical protein [Patescibacteria group bacterium]
MKKTQLAILFLAVIALFALADYFVNLPEGIPMPKPSVSSQKEGDATTPEVINHPNITKQILDQGGLPSDYSLEKRTRSTELFETFDLSELANVSIYKNVLVGTDTQGQLPIYVYEIHGPVGQGGITYLNVKLAMVDQLGSEAGINETGDYGYNSLFYNDSKNPSNGFLLSQVEDMVFGFKYSKKSIQAFDLIKGLVNNYMSSVNNTI